MSRLGAVATPCSRMAQFQEVMRQQLEASMDKELEKLLSVTEGADVEVARKDFEGFKKLFHRFLQAKGPSVDWAKIHRPPEDSVQEYLSRFESIPDMLELDHLTVSGDVTFGKNVSLKGTVIIIANHGDRIDIPAGAMLENKIVSGNLRILDH
ncbi:hypothetical protein Z043_119708 [Scleropages formosus]|uniref:UTP--glucose-1-phosphate uridylyltransferase n=1 Tax=Scleropages formosus TaxID=113540 RepID=A0A0P7TM84_SCLFO|nr:hypothetical protein Z043_119708 [Scleropages formosus]